ncbi:MAG: hypothetical protein L0Z62_21590 [Gemmataceae bacterium]|nr:hypothetical protein [Gemmataceae bacterium]
MKRQLILALALMVLPLLSAYAGGPRQGQKPAANPQQLDALHRLIKPGPGEARWAQVPWARSTDLWAVRQKAAAEGKPVLLWYMAGEPLGTC